MRNEDRSVDWRRKQISSLQHQTQRTVSEALSAACVRDWAELLRAGGDVSGVDVRGILMPTMC